MVSVWYTITIASYSMEGPNFNRREFFAGAAAVAATSVFEFFPDRATAEAIHYLYGADRPADKLESLTIENAQAELDHVLSNPGVTTQVPGEFHVTKLEDHVGEYQVQVTGPEGSVTDITLPSKFLKADGEQVMVLQGALGGSILLGLIDACLATWKAIPVPAHCLVS